MHWWRKTQDAYQGSGDLWKPSQVKANPLNESWWRRSGARMPFSWSAINRALRQRQKLHHASEAGRLRDRRDGAVAVPANQHTGPKPNGMARRPCSNLPVRFQAQADQPPRYPHFAIRAGTAILATNASLSGSAPGMSAAARLRELIPLNGARADVKKPDPLPKG